MAKYKAIFLMTVIAAALYWLNYYILGQTDFPEVRNTFAGMYSFFWVAAVLVIFIVHVVHAKNHDNTGYAFMGVTLLQMGGAYFMVKPFLNVEGGAAQLERTNFFIVFLLFLAIETLITIRLLNNKQ